MGPTDFRERLFSDPVRYCSLIFNNFSYRIHPLNSDFTAEVLAICQASDELAVPEKDILILSDSYSALSLKNITFHSPQIIKRLASKIHVRKNMNQEISLLWVPGHSEIFWNEKADSLAKQVTDSTPFIDWTLFPTRVRLEMVRMSGTFPINACYLLLRPLAVPPVC
ncbi:hypothetical protein AVEN_109045-1 [Araneus ventricosus]|uniref:RNase H type-1 domain-containing protein n=1 Tax=Araneus ventricosus TaxID=182803 RepID=A0A4Y2US69_ARAVE|nr:hypothetical protein AVEN_109045-1 [Araneus ventricosus]